MTSYKWLRLTEEAQVARLTLSRSPINALSLEFALEIEKAVDEIRLRGTASVVHVRSSERVFCGGGDLQFIRSVMCSSAPGIRMREFVAKLQSVLADLSALPAVSVCEIDGAALGGGLEIALACDLRVASRRSKLGFPEVGLGLLPAAGGTQRLTRLVGLTHARRVILRNQILSAEEAQAIGLIDEVFAVEECAARTETLIADLADKPRASLAAAKHCISRADAPDADGYRLELDEISKLVDDPETRQRVSAFLDRAV